MKRVMTMRSANVLRTLALGASLSLFVACGGTSAAESPAATAQSASSKAPVAAGTHGPVKMMGDALGEVPLRPEQRTEIEKLAADSEARHASSKTAHQNLTMAIAAQVEKGSIDRAALKPQIDAATAAWESSRPADRAGLERLHAILDPQQRGLFVDALEAKMHSHMGHGDKAPADKAAGDKAAGEEHAEHHAHGGPMEEWTADLKLTEDQQTKIRTALMTAFSAEHAEHHGEHGEHHGMDHGKKMFEAFRGEKFSLDEVAPTADVRAKAGDMSDKFLKAAEAVLPILTPEQRTIAATKLRARAGDEELAPH